MAHGYRIFVRQTWALTKKTLLIAVVRHWFSTIIRALVLPILFLVLLLNIKNFLNNSNTYGIGSPSAVQSLDKVIPTSEKLVFVQSPGLGPDVTRIINTIANPLTVDKKLVFLTDQNDLLTTCRESLRGVSDCFAAIVFNDSPLTLGGNGIWNYSIRADNRFNGFGFHVNQNSNDEDLVYLPLQVAVENAITNSTIVPNTYMFTSISQATADTRNRQSYQALVISTYSIAFLITIVSPIYHVVGMVTMERESGMTQLIDAMGGSGASRILSYVLAFDIIYTPCWIIFGLLFWSELFPTSSVLISLCWQILNGWAITSASVFSAMFFNRAQMSGIYSTIGFLIIGLGGQILNQNQPGHPQSPDTATVAALSFLFPSMNYIFMLDYMCRYEEQAFPTDLLRAADSTETEPSVSRVPGLLLWVFLIFQIAIYPILAIYVEKLIHGSTSKARTFDSSSDSENSSVAVETSDLTKIYSRKFYQRWFHRGKVTDVVAVTDMDLIARKGQVVCLLGANGSGKTTTLDMIAGLQKLSRGSIRINAESSHIGICPQRNVLWDELTVDEHIKIWNEIKVFMEDNTALESLVEGCDLVLKRGARASTLSGGQKRKLQLACMFVGGSTVCLLDEVTSGLDPLSRRRIWNIILTERSKGTMILTTHFLDEADVLADHVVIITCGRLKCQGSAVELKNELGSGYRVHLRDTKAGPELDFPTKRLPNETVYETPDAPTAARLLRTLESSGHSDVFVNGPSIEDVFLNVAEELNITQEKEPAHAKGEEAVLVRAASAADWDNQLSPGRDTSFYRQVLVLFQKRAMILSHNWWPYLLVLAIPIAMTPPLKAFLDFYTIPSCQDLTADIHVEKPFNFHQGSGSSFQSIQMLAGPASINESLYSVASNFPVGLGINLQNYSGDFLLVNSFSAFQGFISDNYSNIVPGGLYMESNSTAPTYAYVGDHGTFPAMVMQNLWTQLRTGVPIVGNFAYFNSLISPKAGNSVQYISYFCLAQAVYPAFFALYPTFEKTRSVRALQYSNGVRTIPLWTAYALFDSIFVLVIAISCTVVISIEAPHWFAAAYMFPVLTLYGLAATLFAYVISILSQSQLSAFAYTAGAQAVMFLLSIMTFVLLAAFTASANLQAAFDGSAFGLDLIFPIGNVIRAMLIGLNVYVVNCRDGKSVIYPGSIYAYGSPILYLCLQICFLFCLVLWLDSSLSIFSSRQAQSTSNTEHEMQIIIPEVADEKNRVDVSESDPLRILNLTKSFGSNVAVDSVSFGIAPGEILAFIGPNGAGKSTVINMIRGELRPDQGRILVQGIDVISDRRHGQRYLGVCPQFDALDLMTTRQHLNFYARAKGIPTVDQDVNLVMARTGLLTYENRPASKLSGGNKRKLSLAIALLGNPPVLLLDEPSSSMDAISKRVMWKTLAQTHSMEEAEVLATRVAIISKRILALGSTDHLRSKYGKLCHVHLVLRSAPTSTRQEMEKLEQWIDRSFSGAQFDPYGNYHGQIRFSVPAQDGGAAQDTEDCITEVDEISQVRDGVGAMLSLLERYKDEMGLQSYSIRATTMDEVFLKVITENNVQEEGAVEKVSKWRLFGRTASKV